MRPATPLVFVTTPSGCFVPTSHKLNHDGYFRKSFGDKVNGVAVMEMFHRFMWRAHGNSIPAGHEIDHMCRTRSCCNVSHLRCITRAEHLHHTNTTRYAARKEEARLWYLENNHSTGTRLAEVFRVTFSTGCAWIREWNAP